MSDTIPEIRARTFPPRTLAMLLAIPVLVLLIVNLVLGLLLFTGIDRQSQIVLFLRYFDFNDEGTVANWYNTLLLAFACWQAAHAWLASGNSEGRRQLGWIGVALVFFYMSLDENLGIHESQSEELREFFDVGGLLYWAWVIPGAIIALAVAAFFAPFVWKLPHRTRFLIILSGIVYVSGAIGCEMIGGYFYEQAGPGVVSDLASIMEEVMEMSALILFVFAVQEYRLRDTDTA
ncbi:MAG: hypothetical protein ACR2NP_03680 [Pirellulaceae bacterium]